MSEYEGGDLELRSGPLSRLSHDVPEYEERRMRTAPRTSTPPSRAISSRRARRRACSTSEGMSCPACLSHLFATRIECMIWNVSSMLSLNCSCRTGLPWALWLLYWFWQSIALTGLWTLVNFPFVLFPVHPSSNRSHHVCSSLLLLEDETYHPMSREDLKRPDASRATPMDYKQMIEETPLYTSLASVPISDAIYAWPHSHNRKRNPKHRPGTSHHKPFSRLSKPQE
ncbi:hypothetical protein BD414DRAFT_561026, partial [Trametes punicea]